MAKQPIDLPLRLAHTTYSVKARPCPQYVGAKLAFTMFNNLKLRDKGRYAC